MKVMSEPSPGGPRQALRLVWGSSGHCPGHPVPQPHLVIEHLGQALLRRRGRGRPRAVLLKQGDPVSHTRRLIAMQTPGPFG